MNDHFTLTISQSNSDEGDFAIHVSEDKKPETLLVQMKFSNLPMLNQNFVNDFIEELAQGLAKRLVEWRIAPEDEELLNANTEVKKTVSQILEKIKKSSC